LLEYLRIGVFAPSAARRLDACGRRNLQVLVV
jgi:hypothetical protein